MTCLLVIEPGQCRSEDSDVKRLAAMPNIKVKERCCSTVNALLSLSKTLHRSSRSMSIARPPAVSLSSALYFTCLSFAVVPSSLLTHFSRTTIISQVTMMIPFLSTKTCISYALSRSRALPSSASQISLCLSLLFSNDFS